MILPDMAYMRPRRFVLHASSEFSLAVAALLTQLHALRSYIYSAATAFMPAQLQLLPSNAW